MIARCALAIVACIAISGCREEPQGFPLTVDTLQQLTPDNTTALSFRQSGGEILVSITDKYGDGHDHILLLGTTPKGTAIQLLEQKQVEIAGQ